MLHMEQTIYNIIFYILAFFVVGSAAYTAISKNIVRCAFSLVFTFLGVAGLFLLLSADFLAATQMIIYVGGILVLILFAVMLSSRIKDVKISNLSVGRIQGSLIVGFLAAILICIAVQAPWPSADIVEFKPSTVDIGNSLLSTYILPFEVISILILIGLIGAIVIARPVEEEK